MRILIFILLLLEFNLQGKIYIVTSESNSPQKSYAVERITKFLNNEKFKIELIKSNLLIDNEILITKCKSFKKFINKSIDPKKLKSEGYIIRSDKKFINIVGHDPSGILYGCIEVINRYKDQGMFFNKYFIVENPEMIIRGACIGLQKTTYLPGRKVYEYPITPENFSWFYDTILWEKYLDMLVDNKMNALYLWNGHPFASLVRLKDYPYAIEVDEETFQLNKKIFNFLTREAGRRGIWVIQMFYNIIVSKPFADYHGIETQNRNRPITPLLSDYTRKSIAAFIQEYPNVGLMVCLGEAMNTIEDDIEWFTNTIIPGVKDGLKALGITEEPPIILRAHDTDAERVINAALPLYKNLYTMHKYNGESLTTYQPRGAWAELHQKLSKLGSIHIANVHILANLEPFRYGSPDFIRKSVIAMHDILGANGLHLYPQASYWDWPYTADNTFPRLLQIDRDWIWYKAWGRYAWNCRRDENDEKIYWSRVFENFYGLKKGYGTYILTAYDETGEIAPKLLRRFGITDGNRQTLTLGMFMSQLVNPYKWQVYSNFYSSNGPEGEILIEYAKKEWYKEPHIGETPPQIINEVITHAEKALKAIEYVSSFVTLNKEEFTRLKNDVYSYYYLAYFFYEKVNSALKVLRYKYSREINDLDSAIINLEKSIAYYQKLADITKNTYLYANSMQTQQRRIPISGEGAKNKHWTELLLHYQKELENFKHNVELLKKYKDYNVTASLKPIEPIKVQVECENCELYDLEKDQKVFIDKDYFIKDIAIELSKLKGIRFSYDYQIDKGTKFTFYTDRPVKLLLGYFNGNSLRLLRPPTLETDANAAEYGQSDIKIANAIDIPGLYPVNVYNVKYDKGKHEVNLNKGLVLVLGFIDGSIDISIRDAGLGVNDENALIDWLFY